MKTSKEIRVENLAKLINEAGGNAKFAQIIDKSEAQVSQWLNSSRDSKTGKPRGISSETSRYIEKKCQREIGWMDNSHTDISADPNWFSKLPANYQQILKAYIVAPEREKAIMMSFVDSYVEAYSDPAIKIHAVK